MQSERSESAAPSRSGTPGLFLRPWPVEMRGVIFCRRGKVGFRERNRFGVERSFFGRDDRTPTFPREVRQEIGDWAPIDCLCNLIWGIYFLQYC